MTDKLSQEIVLPVAILTDRCQRYKKERHDMYAVTNLIHQDPISIDRIEILMNFNKCRCDQRVETDAS